MILHTTVPWCTVSARHANVSFGSISVRQVASRKWLSWSAHVVLHSASPLAPKKCKMYIYFSGEMRLPSIVTQTAITSTAAACVKAAKPSGQSVIRVCTTWATHLSQLLWPPIVFGKSNDCVWVTLWNWTFVDRRELRAHTHIHKCSCLRVARSPHMEQLKRM